MLRRASIRWTPSLLLRPFSAAATPKLGKIESKLAEMKLTLPVVPAPAGNYMNFVKTGNLLFLAGHLPKNADGSLVKGRLGENMTIDQGAAAARLAALQMLATVKSATGNLDKVTRVVKVVGLVCSANDFTAQPAVMNGCSDFIGEVFGTEVGRHARSAIGVNTLPLGVAVEIEAVFEVSK